MKGVFYEFPQTSETIIAKRYNHQLNNCKTLTKKRNKCKKKKIIILRK